MSHSGKHVTLFVKHNMEVAHRLFTLPGKCQQIHGHSMQVRLEVHCDMDTNGYALQSDGTVLEFGDLKKQFRHYIDEVWDHHLHLNENDPLAQPLQHSARGAEGQFVLEGQWLGELPGLMKWPGDPSTENIAHWIREYMTTILPGMSFLIQIDETGTNGVVA